MYLCLIHCKIETKCPILEISFVPEKNSLTYILHIIFQFLRDLTEIM